MVSLRSLWLQAIVFLKECFQISEYGFFFAKLFELSNLCTSGDLLRKSVQNERKLNGFHRPIFRNCLLPRLAKK